MRIIFTVFLGLYLLSAQFVLAEKNTNNYQNLTDKLVLSDDNKQTSQQTLPSSAYQSPISSKKDEKGWLDKWWELSAINKKMLVVIPFGLAIVLWGFFRFVFTGKQFGKNEYTVLEKIKLGEKTFAETRKNNNSGLVFYFTYGPIEKKLRGRITKEAYEELKSKVTNS